MKALGLFLFFFVFAATLGTGSIDNGFASKEADLKKIDISVIDQEQSKKLFDELARDKEIPFKYPLDGCFARATEMSRVAEKENIVMGRIYAEGRLQVKTGSFLYPFVQWGWHVAPVAYVRQANGFDQMMVFDPSLFKKPVTVAEWLVKMSAEGPKSARIDKVYYGSRFQYLSKGQEESRLAWDNKDLIRTKMIMAKFKPLEDIPTPLIVTPLKSSGTR